MRSFDTAARIAIDPNAEDGRFPLPGRRLFQAVIVIAIQDCLGKGAASLPRGGVENARRWVGCDLFDHTCDLAGMDAESIRRKLRSLIAANNAAHAASPLLLE
jgi:hypothetical protein